MDFSSVSFLFFFLPGVLGCYALATHRWRNLVLLGASGFFYVWGAGVLVGLLLASIALGWVTGLLASEGVIRGDRGLRRAAVAISVGGNVAMLAAFKYAGWFIDTVDGLGLPSGAAPDLTVPLGISFFTLQSMSYTIDVARGRCDHLDNLFEFALYVAMFPVIPAGPILRFHQVESQLGQRPFTAAQFGEGAIRFSHGLVKKVVIADAIAPVADAAFGADDLTMTAAWVGILAFSMQIYFDFSGYADMAIGLGRMFGFRLPENFDRPYSAVSLTDFWRRWLISLSGWLRDYVYIPLGGSRNEKASLLYRNLTIVFLLTGLWHGASWTFVVWGLYHGGWLLVERRYRWRQLELTGGRAVVRRATTFLIVMVGWVIFRAPSLGDAFDYLVTMVSFDGFGLGELTRAATTRSLLTLAFASLVVLVSPRVVLGPILVREDHFAARAARAIVMVGLLPFALLLVASGAISPFLYEFAY